ncbi:MAG: hypothetical protein HQL13_03030 [Candidatus Omnitrophica bacterium]|nr:hypothetical protein [Candidatus Omnitrophota bacterium]
MHKSKAFTIYEFVLVIVLVSILFAVTAPLMLEIAASWQGAQNTNEMTASAQIAMDRMIREIRLINSNTSVNTASASSFQFVDVNNNTITYNVNNNHLIRTVGGVANQLADNVTNLTFTYYNSSGSTIASATVSPSATNIVRIVIDLTLTLGTTITIESGVSPRSLQ